VDVLTMKELLETGVHFGHRTRKWNPKMARYIFTERKGIHIIDLEQTVDLFRKAYYSVRDCVASGGEVVFVGTKKQVQATISDEALRCGAHYVNQRWLGGTLTNFATIKLSIERMKKMEAMIEDGSIEFMPNKEASRMRRRLAKLQRNLDGLRRMDKKPSLMYVIDPDSETIAVHEANLAGIPVIAIVDTNCDPDPIDFLIPGNDDAIKATKLITARIADAIIEGREGRQDENESPVATAEAAKAEEAPVAKVEEAVVEAAEVVAEAEAAPVAEVEEAVVEAAEEVAEAKEAPVAEVEEAVVEAAEEVAEAEAEATSDEAVVEETVEEAPVVAETEDEPKVEEDEAEAKEEVAEEASQVEDDKEKETDDD
jgi:small subunit ribosomal protein S2